MLLALLDFEENLNGCNCLYLCKRTQVVYRRNRVSCSKFHHMRQHHIHMNVLYVHFLALPICKIKKRGNELIEINAWTQSHLSQNCNYNLRWLTENSMIWVIFRQKVYWIGLCLSSLSCFNEQSTEKFCGTCCSSQPAL